MTDIKIPKQKKLSRDYYNKDGELLEKGIQRMICDWLFTQGVFFWRSNNTPVFGQSNDGLRRFRALPKYTPKGLPDIICIYKGKFIGLEVKRPNMKLRPDQEIFYSKCVGNGGIYFQVHSLEEVKLIFSQDPIAYFLNGIADSTSRKVSNL